MTDDVTEGGAAEQAAQAISVPLNRVPAITGLARTRIFEAVKSARLTIRKDGKSSIVEMEELRRYVRSLPTRGRAPEGAAA